MFIYVKSKNLKYVPPLTLHLFCALQVAEADPSRHWPRGELHPGQVAGSSQGNIAL